MRRFFVPPTSRRTLLKGLGIGAALSACKPAEPVLDTGNHRTPEPSEQWPGLGDADDALFPLGIQSGDPSPDGAVLWTRYDGVVTLGVVVASWDGTQWVERPEAACTLADGGFVHHEVDGFEPDQPLAFQFRDADGKRSPVARLRTAPDPSSRGDVTFVTMGGCRTQNHPNPSMTHAARRARFDFDLWMGDTVYADGATTVEDYRAFWAENFPVQGFRDLFTVTPSVPNWDDHEVANNWDEDPPAPEVLAAAYQAFFEHAPMRRHPQHPRRIWRSFRYGRTAEFFVLDCRGERIFKEQYISEEQMAWLKEGLSSSPCTWKVVVHTVPISDMPITYDVPAVLYDRWEGHPEQRRELLDYITDSDLSGVFFVTGDFHQTTLSRVDAEGPASRLLEFTTGAVGSNNNILAPTIQDGAQFLYADAIWSVTYFKLSEDGYCRITTVDDEDNTVFNGMIDTRGNVLWYEMSRRYDEG